MYETPDGEVKAKTPTEAARWYFQAQLEKGTLELKEGASLNFTISGGGKEHSYEGVLQKASKYSTFNTMQGKQRAKLKMVVHKAKSVKVARKNKTNQLLEQVSQKLHTLTNPAEPKSKYDEGVILGPELPGERAPPARAARGGGGGVGGGYAGGFVFDDAMDAEPGMGEPLPPPAWAPRPADRKVEVRDVAAPTAPAPAAPAPGGPDYGDIIRRIQNEMKEYSVAQEAEKKALRTNLEMAAQRIAQITKEHKLMELKMSQLNGASVQLRAEIEANKRGMGGVKVSGPDAGAPVIPAAYAEKMAKIEEEAKATKERMQQMEAEIIEARKLNAAATVADPDVMAAFIAGQAKGLNLSQTTNAMIRQKPEKAHQILTAAEKIGNAFAATQAADAARLKNNPVAAHEVKQAAKDAKAAASSDVDLVKLISGLSEKVDALAAKPTEPAAAPPEPAEAKEPEPPPSAPQPGPTQNFFQINFGSVSLGAPKSNQSWAPNTWDLSGGLLPPLPAEDGAGMDVDLVSRIGGGPRIVEMKDEPPARPAGTGAVVARPDGKVPDAPIVNVVRPPAMIDGGVVPAPRQPAPAAPAAPPALPALPAPPSEPEPPRQRPEGRQLIKAGPEKDQKAIDLAMREKGSAKRQQKIQELALARKSLRDMTGQVKNVGNKEIEKYMKEVKAFNEVAKHDFNAMMQRNPDLARDYAEFGKEHADQARFIYDMKKVMESQLDMLFLKVPGLKEGEFAPLRPIVREILTDSNIPLDQGNVNVFLAAVARDSKARSAVSNYFNAFKTWVTAADSKTMLEQPPKVLKLSDEMQLQLQRVARTAEMQALSGGNARGVAAPSAAQRGTTVVEDKTKDLPAPVPRMLVTAAAEASPPAAVPALPAPTSTALIVAGTERQVEPPTSNALVVAGTETKAVVPAPVPQPAPAAQLPVAQTSSSVVQVKAIVDYFREGLRTMLSQDEIKRAEVDPEVKAVLEGLRAYVMAHEDANLDNLRTSRAFTRALRGFAANLHEAVLDALKMTNLRDRNRVEQRFLQWNEGVQARIGLPPRGLIAGAPVDSRALQPVPITLAPATRLPIGAPTEAKGVGTEIVRVSSGKTKRKKSPAPAGSVKVVHATGAAGPGYQPPPAGDVASTSIDYNTGMIIGE